MPKQTTYDPGQFSWVELGTTDAEAAKRFYGPLFGWTFLDAPGGPGTTYAMCKLGDAEVAALYTMGKEMQGVPPHWLPYVTVSDVDAVATKFAAGGGKIMKDAFDVPEVARMAVVQDPTGATLALWHPTMPAGATATNEPGAMTWSELYTTNVDRAGKFYMQTFGWKAESMSLGPMGTYTLFSLDGSKATHRGGMLAMPATMKGAPSHWLTHFATTDCDASTRRATELGGRALMPPTAIPDVGTFSVIQDPQGAVFALFQPVVR